MRFRITLQHISTLKRHSVIVTEEDVAYTRQWLLSLLGPTDYYVEVVRLEADDV